MPRKPREEIVDGIFHVFARGNDKRLIYRDELDRQIYLRLLAARSSSDVAGGCSPSASWTNHLHLLIETPDANLGVGMQRLHSDYAHAVQPPARALWPCLSGAVWRGSCGEGRAAVGCRRLHRDESGRGGALQGPRGVAVGQSSGDRPRWWAAVAGRGPVARSLRGGGRRSARAHMARCSARDGRSPAGAGLRCGELVVGCRVGLVRGAHLVDGRHAEVLVHQDLQLRAVGAADVRLVGRPVVRVGLDSLDGAAADLVERRLRAPSRPRRR